MKMGVLQAQLRLNELLAFDMLLDNIDEARHGLEIFVPSEHNPIVEVSEGRFC